MYDLIKYFKEFPKENRMEVELFVSDMWKTYFKVSETWLKNASTFTSSFQFMLNSERKQKKHRHL